MFRITFIIMMLGLVGCQSHNDGVAHLRPVIRLHIILPMALSRNETRFVHFAARVSSIEIKLKSREGALLTQSLPPGQWDELPLPNIEFPRGTEDRLNIRVRVWDRNGQGGQRGYPVLIGKVEVNADELSLEAPNIIPIRLNLRVSVKEFDNNIK